MNTLEKTEGVIFSEHIDYAADPSSRYLTHNYLAIFLCAQVVYASAWCAVKGSGCGK